MNKSTITRERLQEITEDGFLKHGESKELARMALAAMDSEPVAWLVGEAVLFNPDTVEAYAKRSELPVTPLYAHPPINQQEPVAWDYEWASCITCEGPQNFNRVIEREAPPEWAIIEGQARNVIPLYRHAQPAPVVPDEKPMPNPLSMYAVDAVAAIAEVKGWNACRAVMLDNCATVESRNNAGCSPKNGLKCAAVLQAEPVTTANKLGNSPVTPDTWIPVSERLPEFGDYLVTDGCDFDVQLFNGEEFIPGFIWEDKITHWMPLPSAPQEVKGE
ncbi:TPA: DUF551 domain-containing protein [Klebsiella aerogenes]|nr:DUF551 domain-containing protein [Klebsiella aerogenes]